MKNEIIIIIQYINKYFIWRMIIIEMYISDRQSEEYVSQSNWNLRKE